MTKFSPFTQQFDQLPSSLAIFPLRNAIVLPGSQLPLNIFEPRYLSMVTDAMKTDQLIGMIQPRDDDGIPKLFDVGCAARITRYEEMNDGRLEVVLTGLCRFSVENEIPSIRGYRIVAPNWQKFKQDLSTNDSISQENTLLLNGALRQYFTREKIDVDWTSISQVPIESVLNSLISQLSLASEDKQLLIEAPNINARVKSFCALIEIRNNEEQAH